MARAVDENSGVDEAQLARLPLFSQLSRHERRQVARWADEVDVAEGRTLATQGEFGYEFFVIEEGTADVLKDGARVRTLGPGDFFGEIALLETERRTATVTATSPMRLVVMTRRDFRHMAKEMPEVAARLEQAIRERIGG
jgi:CRP-like cAMP-binding protein